MSAGWLRACALVMLGLFSVSALAKDKTAIVIGGGLSGLTAAYELQNKGWQVTLLEAIPSLGGRSGMATSEWIGNDKTQPVLNKYVSTFKLSTTPAPEFVRTPGYLIDGEYFSAADLATKQPATADALHHDPGRRLMTDAVAFRDMGPREAGQDHLLHLEADDGRRVLALRQARQLHEDRDVMRRMRRRAQHRHAALVHHLAQREFAHLARHAQRPSKRRAASASGRPAARIFRAAPSTS